MSGFSEYKARPSNNEQPHSGPAGAELRSSCLPLTWLLLFILPPSCCCSVTKLCPPLCDLMDCSKPGFPVLHYLPELVQMHIHWVNNATQLSHSLSPPSPAFNPMPSIRVFSNESALHIRWTKYWSFSFSISPSSEHSGLISFRIDWFDLLAV